MHAPTASKVNAPPSDLTRARSNDVATVENEFERVLRGRLLRTVSSRS